LALGADLKSSITLAVHGQAFVSQHLGDLENLAAFQAFQETIYDLCQMYRVKLEDALVVHDLHPNYASTRFALEAGSQRLGVQHHEAHIASVLAEHKAWDAPVLGFAFDGTGFGHDSTIWGGEVFHGSLEHGFERVAHLRTAPVPGGDAAARHPTQAAVGFLANCKDAVLEKILEKPFNFPSQRVQVARALISSGLNTSATSSMGRLFDTISALTGFTRKMSFEGQAAIRLEALARGLPAEYPYPFPFDGNTWDYAPLLKALLEDVAAGIKVSIIARRFHETIAQGVLEATQTLARSRSFAVVALSGGVFQNRLLLELCLERLHRHGFEVWFNRFVPANDGGISLGQAALAAHQEV
jgi:hydrogenase maturation protein HypF